VDAWVAENNKALRLAVSNGLRESAQRSRIHTNPRDERVFRPPTAVERAEARAQIGIETGTVAIGLLARLVPEKGVLLFLDAAEQLLREGWPGHFVVAGSGPLLDEARHRARPGITVLGRVPHPDGVVQLCHALDVVACPSLRTSAWEDQGPRALLEAMMCGCTPMGTPTGAIAQMFGSHGVIAASTSVADVAVALRDAADIALRDGASRSEIASWARDRFSAAAVSQQLVDLWHELASPCTSPRTRSAPTVPGGET
jgi:glycosyltransferase involved in cell wall biosynthesis